MKKQIRAKAPTLREQNDSLRRKLAAAEEKYDALMRALGIRDLQDRVDQLELEMQDRAFENSDIVSRMDDLENSR